MHEFSLEEYYSAPPILSTFVCFVLLVGRLFKAIPKYKIGKSSISEPFWQIKFDVFCTVFLLFLCIDYFFGLLTFHDGQELTLLPPQIPQLLKMGVIHVITLSQFKYESLSVKQPENPEPDKSDSETKS
jgi:hypothetical protein